MVIIEMENGKEIKIELYPDIAPISCENFEKLVNQGFYDGLCFHRVIPGFMIQGGCPDGTGTGGPGWSIKGEFASNGIKNDLKHTRGVISMARSMMPNSAGSQFFIMHEDAPHLDGDYAAFGKVVEGMETVDEIAAVQTDRADKPITPQIIKRAYLSKERHFMKLHYKGTFDLNPDSLPHGEHKPNAVPFKEAESPKKLAIIANIVGVVIMILLAIPAFIRCWEYINPSSCWQLFIGSLASLLILFPHEFLHAVCFKEDVYLYTNFKQGMLFVVGPEVMSKSRFIFMSLLPNIVFGFIPYIIGIIFPKLLFLTALGIIATGSGAGDYYNVFHALTQMPKGAKTYMYKFNSFWFMPE